MLWRDSLRWLVFGHANATTWIANAMACGAMQGPAPTMSNRLDNRGPSSFVWRIMGERTDRCRENAVECKRMAMAVTDQTIRSIYLDLAKEWTAMAEEAEELERRFPVRAACAAHRSIPASAGPRHDDVGRQGNVPNAWRIRRARAQHHRRARSCRPCAGQGRGQAARLASDIRRSGKTDQSGAG
jgi:hypothetical protein